MVKKKNIIKNIVLVITVLVLMALIVYFVGRSYGFFQYVKKGETTNVITIKGIRVDIIEDDNALNLENAEPLYDSDGMQLKAFTFSITNTSKRPLEYTMKVVNDTDKQSACLINEGEPNEATCPVLTTDNIRYSYKLNNGSWNEAANLGANNDVITTYTINGNETLTYSIKMWIKSDATNDIMNHYFFGQLIIQGTQATIARCDSTNPNSIGMWLSCGNVNKNYTTLSQVLNDTTTLQTLINSNSANDYLVASTDWVSDITANETAMTYIGNNNYSANALLADSTWLNAIANSTYFESVLNVKVPVMTSNNTPSGQVLSYGNRTDAGYYDYAAFDKDLETKWSGGVADNYIGYMFTNQMKIKLVKMTYIQYNFSSFQFAIESSNDGSSWNTLTSQNLTNSTSSLTQQQFSLILDNTSYYQQYRLYSPQNLNVSGGSFVLISELQFYGREDVE